MTKLLNQVLCLLAGTIVLIGRIIIESRLVDEDEDEYDPEKED